MPPFNLLHLLWKKYSPPWIVWSLCHLVKKQQRCFHQNMQFTWTGKSNIRDCVLRMQQLVEVIKCCFKSFPTRHCWPEPLPGKKRPVWESSGLSLIRISHGALFPHLLRLPSFNNAELILLPLFLFPPWFSPWRRQLFIPTSPMAVSYVRGLRLFNFRRQFKQLYPLFPTVLKWFPVIVEGRWASCSPTLNHFP